jgi:PhnB protein
MQVQPYLYFNGRCEEAIEFYRKTLDAEVMMLMRFKECPDQTNMTPGTEDKVMHATLRVGDAMVLVSDGQCGGQAKFQGFALAITVSDADRAQRIFTALGQGGQVQMPLTKTFFSPAFGMVADRFGVGWLVMARASNG